MSEVHHPRHYTSHPSGVECVTIAEHFNFNLGNALKYVWRAGLKGALLIDLEKARFYVDREHERLSGPGKLDDFGDPSRKHPSGVERADVTRHFTEHLALAIDHIWIAGLYPGATFDLRQALAAIDREITRVKQSSSATPQGT